MNKLSGGKSIIKSLAIFSPFFDIILSPLTLIAALWFRVARYWGIKKLPLTKRIFLKLGMFPIVNHYYDPLFDYRKIKSTSVLSNPDWVLNSETQLNFLRTLNYKKELTLFPINSRSENEYYYNNGSFGSGDSELYYSIIRKIKPEKIIEVGSGFSTRIAVHAIQRNKEENAAYSCSLTCIEPYEMPWLEKMKVDLLRINVEDIIPGYFNQLNEGDILFIDSSHIIRPGGDINFLILNVLPNLNNGVWIHFHDIFTPTGYPVSWMKDEFRLWNEQYMLEAFLINNNSFEVIMAMNFINKNYKNEIDKVFPILAQQVTREPGSFWLRKKT